MSHKATSINIPIVSLKPLYRNDKTRTLVFETSLDALQEVNEPETLDEIIALARMDYARGDYKSTSNVEELIADLDS